MLRERRDSSASWEPYIAPYGTIRRIDARDSRRPKTASNLLRVTPQPVLSLGACRDRAHAAAALTNRRTPTVVGLSAKTEAPAPLAPTSRRNGCCRSGPW